MMRSLPDPRAGPRAEQRWLPVNPPGDILVVTDASHTGQFLSPVSHVCWFLDRPLSWLRPARKAFSHTWEWPPTHLPPPRPSCLVQYDSLVPAEPCRERPLPLAASQDAPPGKVLLINADHCQTRVWPPSSNFPAPRFQR